MPSHFASHQQASTMKSYVFLHTHSLHDSEADWWNWRTSIFHNGSFFGICWMFSSTALNPSIKEWTIVYKSQDKNEILEKKIQWSAISWPDSASWQWIRRMLCTLHWWLSSHKNHPFNSTLSPNSTNSSIAAPPNSIYAKDNGFFGSFPTLWWIPPIMGPFAKCESFQHCYT